ncbi:MAG TPA: RsmB/NOP family class I SAM-dependent RNA methyltransferase [Jatrophihabitans sp.]
MSKPLSLDRARRAAFRALQAVSQDSAYANLVLPRLISQERLDGRDAALATELAYGTLRASGTLRQIIAACLSRNWSEVDGGVQDLLLLGAYQLLRTRIPSHAAVSTTIELARVVGSGRASGLLNAVLRKVSAQDWDAWCEQLSRGTSPIAALALRTAHPEWIAEAFADALAGGGSTDLTETAAALAADDERPVTHLVAWPGMESRDELVAASGGGPGPYSPYAVRMEGGDPGAIEAVRNHRAAVQDEGSQLCALALTRAPLRGRDERWLDLCAGPGGKAALLAALAAERGAVLTANELYPHRAELVRQATQRWNVEVTVGDAREYEKRWLSRERNSRVEAPATEGRYDRILVDAPCTGLGALRRRPEARWRRNQDDLADLVALQRELIGAALRLLRPGGVLAYVTCSPHPAETTEQVAGLDLFDARPSFPGVDQLGAGPTVQLWPHRHGTDAMFCALITR